MNEFNPNRRTLEEGLGYLKEINAKTGFSIDKDIITSKDENVIESTKMLKVTNIPSGFNKWQLPVHMTGQSLLYFSYGAPNTKVPNHSHDEGDGLRVITSGSIKYKGKELTAGDWMYIPAGAKYDFEVGPMGVGMFYCYQCCCA